MFRSGEKPGKGWYVCIRCNEDLFLNEDSDRLPPCAKCDGSEFKKVKLKCRNCGRFASVYFFPKFKAITRTGEEIEINFCRYCMKRNL